MAIRILSSENITGKLTLTGQEELLELTRGGASDSKWFFSADSLKLYIAEGTSAPNNIKMTLTDAGNIGIGTLSPIVPLQIFGAGNYDPSSSGGQTTNGILIKGGGTTGDDTYTAGIGFAHGTGTSGISGVQNGSDGDRMGLGFFTHGSGTGSAASSLSMIIQSGGEVGIGTAGPEKKLHILTSTTDDTPQVLIQNGSSGDASLTFNVSGQSYVIGIDHDDSSKFKIAASGNLGTNDRVTLLSSGNVGIGTITPTQSKLVISGGATGTTGGGDAGITMINKFDDPDNSWSILPQIPGVANTGLTIRDNTDSADRLVIDGSGNIGIGTTSPDEKLDITGGYLKFNGGDYGLKGSASLSYNATSDHYFQASGSTKVTIKASGNVGIGLTNPSQKLEVTGNFKLNGTFVQEGTGNNLTYRYRTGNSTANTTANATVKFGRIYWTPAHWVTGAPVIKVTLHSKYYQGERREYIIKAGYQDTDPIINELQSSSVLQRITLRVGATTSAGYNYANQPVYYADLQWVQTSYMWGWAQIESQVAFLTSNPTSGWGGVVMDSAITQNNNTGLVTNYNSFFAGNLGIGTSNPDNPLFIFTDTKDSTVFKIRNYLATANGTVYQNFSELKFLADTNGNAPAGIRHYANLWHNADSALAFFTNQHGGSYTERMRIDGDGNVGINVTDPSAVLDIYSPYDVTSNPNSTGIRLRRVAGGSQSFLLGMGVSGVSNNYFAIRDITNSAYRFVINDSGNVAIGTTTSSNKLFVANGSIAINNSHSFMVGGDNDTAIGRLKNTAGVFNLEGDGTRSIRFGSGTNGEVVRIDNTNERVGIGITNPSEKLHVNGRTILQNTEHSDYATGSINTTGVVVATVPSSTNGQSVMITFEATGGTGSVYSVIYSCYNGGGNWYYTKNVLVFGGNIEVAETNGSGSSTLSFSFRSTSGTAAYTPRVIMKGSPYGLVSFV